jgi:hypothetical protein
VEGGGSRLSAPPPTPLPDTRNPRQPAPARPIGVGDAPVPWTATASPNGTTPFQKGDAEVKTHATGYDSDHGQYVTVDSTAVVNLNKSKP